ncbi:MerR family DNA-binding transcriptional regulator [Geodermatophilus sp. DF01-2]|nr:MerR family DNA-binding transcriptional regulator [Geodermatophilus sp. DF01_2]
MRIGELAGVSGLTVSALRFYDAAGVLVPAAVDPVTGYRRYAAGQVRAAQVLAGLRRVGLPVARLAVLLERLDDAAAVHRAVEAHLRDLEDGLADARREADRMHRLLGTGGGAGPDVAAGPTRARVAAADLAAAVDAVRFAVGTDPGLPALNGTLLELGGDTVRLVATDRYRLAVAELPATLDGPGGSALLPAGLLDAARALLAGGSAGVAVDAGSVSVGSGGAELAGTPLPHAFPDWRRVARERRAVRVAVDGGRLRRALEAAPTRTVERAGTLRQVAVLTAAGGDAAFVAPGDRPDGRHVGVDREFLLQALDAGGPGQLELELDGPLRPLALRRPAGTAFSLLMPVRL